MLLGKQPTDDLIAAASRAAGSAATPSADRRGPWNTSARWRASSPAERCGRPSSGPGSNSMGQHTIRIKVQGVEHEAAGRVAPAAGAFPP